MAQVEWPTRHVHCSTLGGGGGTYFSVNPSDRNSLVPGSAVVQRVGENGFDRYIQTSGERAPPEDWYLTNANGATQSVTGSFTLEVDVGIVVNYPTRPMLVDPSAKSITTPTNPLAISGYTAGEPRYQGSVMLAVGHHADVPIVEAFIDQLYDPTAWFELPLPGDHLEAQNVTAYDDATGNITMTLGATYGDRNLHGYFARVGARTVKVVYHRRQGATNNHIIRIVPALISGTTADAQANSFSNVTTIRVRAENIVSTGNADFGATWTMDWAETNRTD